MNEEADLWWWVVHDSTPFAKLLHVFENLMSDLWRQTEKVLRVDINGVGVVIKVILKHKSDQSETSISLFIG